jgi:photosystem II stability/assembly factor-like uncharacterized protein
MKKIYFLSLLLFIVYGSFAQIDIFQLMERRDIKLQQIDSIAQRHFDAVGTDRGSGYTQYQRWLFEQKFHLDNAGYIRPPADENAAFEQAMQSMQPNSITGNWIERGPTSWNRTTGWNPGVGRITCIGISPLDTTVIYIGSPGGGIWKSINSGSSWAPLSDNASNRLTVNAIAVDPANVNVVYAAASGTFKSTDGGNTWITMGTIAGTVRKFLVQPGNSNIVFAASTSGIYRSTNAGGTWTLVSSISTEDIEFNPTDVNIMYAAGTSATGHVQRSVNNGANWTALGTAQGITNSGRTLVAVSPANPNVVYAVQANGSLFGRLYQSTDAGISFTTRVVGNPSSATNYFGYETTGTGTGGQATYDMAMCVSPTNADEVHIAGIICWKSTDGGTSFIAETAWSLPNSIGYNHADVHTLDWVKNTIYSSSDGGIYKSMDKGDNWIDLTTGMGIRQFYRIDCSQTNAEMYGGGAQDNGSSMHKTTGWIDWLGADGMEMEFSYTNANIVYGTSQNGKLYSSNNGGSSYSGLTQPSSGQWVTPFAVHPTNDSIVFVGWTGVYKTIDRGNNWTKISGTSITTSLACLTVSLSNPNYIYTSNGTALYVTNDGGTTWTAKAATGTITSILVHPTNPAKIWITTSSSGTDRVMVSTNEGGTFTSIAGTLPAIGARTIVIDKNDPKETLYLGMNTGVYYRDNTMSDWTPFLTGLPLVAINELDIQLNSRKIRVGTYGRGVWDNDLVFGTPIPVRWLSFTGKKTTAGNQLNWKVQENSSTDKYELEYSPNGVRFSAIKAIEALAKLQNSSSLAADYSHSDAATGDAYYRLKQFDKSGQSYYSDIVLLKDGRKEQLSVYPNPVQNKLSISIPGNLRNSNAIIQVYNTSGIMLLQQTESSNTSTINTARFSAGQYILRVIVYDKVYQQVFFKGK